jgi:hypothetical protein
MSGRPEAGRYCGRRRRETSRVSAAIAAIVVLFCWSRAFASTIKEIEMVCPYDGTKFSYTAQMSASVFDTALDFRKTGAVISPWPIAVCPTNGFVFFKEKFEDEELERLRPLILSPEYQALKGETAYYRAAWIGRHTGEAHGEVSYLLLQATWEASRDSERYRRYAAELIDRLPDDIRASSGDGKRMFQLVLGELMRRRGRFTEARQYFVELERQLEPASTESVVAGFEIQLIDKQDSQQHLYSEALKWVADAKPDIWLARHTPSLSDGSHLVQTRVFKLDRVNRIHWLGNDRLWGPKYPNVMTFDLGSGATTSIETPVIWDYTSTSSRDGKIIISEGRIPPFYPILFQADSRSFTTRNQAAVSGYIPAIVMAHDGKSALTELDNRLMAFDIGADALRPLRSPTSLVGRADWWLKAADPTGPRVALYHDDEILVWDYEKGVLLRQLHPAAWIKSMTIDLDVVYSHDGKRLFVGADAYWDRECELTVWDSESGAQLARKRVKGAPGAQLAVSPDERTVAMICGKSLYLWDLSLSDAPFETAQATGDSPFRETSFSPDSRKLAVSLDDALLVFSVNR